MEIDQDLVNMYVRANVAARALVSDADAELEYVRRARGGDVEARNVLFCAQLMSLYGMARKRNFRSYRGDAVEMVDVVMLRFDEVLEKFDETRGVRLFTHLVNWARSYMVTELVADRAGVVVPANVFKEGRANEVAQCVSGLSPAGCDDDGLTIFDLVADGSVDIHGDAEVRDRRRRVARYMSGLDGEEKEVIRRVYLEEQSLGDTGRALGMSKDRVRAIRDRALLRMREMADAEGVLGGADPRSQV